MQISSSTQNPYITQTTSTNSVQKTNKTVETTEISSISESKYTPPNQLSYEDYQSISYKDIESLYPAATILNKNGYTIGINENGNDETHRKAVELWQVANTFEDDILGKTLFTQAIKDNPSKVDTLINDQISASSYFKWEALMNKQSQAEDDYTIKMITKNDPPYTTEKFAQYFGTYSSEFRAKYPNDPAIVTQEKLDYANEHTRISSERLFEMVNLSLNDTKDWGNPNRVHFSETYKTQDIFIHIDEVMAQFSKLREDYQQKLQEIPEYKSVEVFV